MYKNKNAEQNKYFRMSHKIGVGTVVQKRTRIHPIIKYPLGGAIGVGFIGHMYSQHNSQEKRSAFFMAGLGA